jgi:hypothetical protein
MPWYIPLLSTLLGAVISLTSSFAITRYTFTLQRNHERKNLLIALSIEIKTLVKLLEQACVDAVPEVTVVLPPKKEFENLCAIYKGNCGKVGLLTAIAASEIVAFYSCALSLSPKDPAGNGGRYDAKNVAACIALGKRIQSTLESMELTDVRDCCK